MRANISLAKALGFAACLVLSNVFLVGCKTPPKIDWNSRIGNYTYDQAVAELGPPDKSAKLSDGKTVAEWIKHARGGGMSFGVGTGFYGGHTAVGVGQSIAVGPGDRMLHLVFGPDNKLVQCFKNY